MKLSVKIVYVNHTDGQTKTKFKNHQPLICSFLYKIYWFLACTLPVTAKMSRIWSLPRGE